MEALQDETRGRVYSPIGEVLRMIVSRGLYESNYKQKGLKPEATEGETWRVGVGPLSHRRAEAQNHPSQASRGSNPKPAIQQARQSSNLGTRSRPPAHRVSRGSNPAPPGKLRLKPEPNERSGGQGRAGEHTGVDDVATPRIGRTIPKGCEWVCGAVCYAKLGRSFTLLVTKPGTPLFGA